MSTIAAVRRDGIVSISCDTLTKQGSGRESGIHVVNHSKILSVNGSYIGLVGPTSTKLVLQHYFNSENKAPLLTTVEEIFETWRVLHEVLKEKYFLRPYAESEDSYESSRMDAIIINSAGLFFVSAYRSVQEFTRFYACGSGTEYALGAMDALFNSTTLSAGEISRLGVESAAEFDDGTGLPILSFHVEMALGESI